MHQKRNSPTRSSYIRHRISPIFPETSRQPLTSFDKYGFKAVDSIRSFAQQMLHLASGNVNIISVATGQTAPYSPKGLEARTTAQTRDSFVYYVTKSYDFAIQSIKTVDPNKLGEITGPGANKVTRYAWLLKGFEHQTHHRGQCTIYIRLLGIRPPNEMLF